MIFVPYSGSEWLQRNGKMGYEHINKNQETRGLGFFTHSSVTQKACVDGWSDDLGTIPVSNLERCYL